MAVGGGLFNDRTVGRRTDSRAPATPAIHTYELRRTTRGWLLLVDDKVVQQCATLPEANLALIAARTADAAPRSMRLGRAPRS